MKAEIKFRFDMISKFGCIVCRLVHGVITQPHVHHLTGIKYRAMGKKADDKDTIGLCPFHHDELHSRLGMRKWEELYWPQSYLLKLTNEFIEKAN